MLSDLVEQVPSKFSQGFEGVGGQGLRPQCSAIKQGISKGGSFTTQHVCKESQESTTELWVANPPPRAGVEVGEAQGTGGQCDASASKGGSRPPTRDFTQLALLSAHFLHGEFFFNSICKRESVPFRKER